MYNICLNHVNTVEEGISVDVTVQHLFLPQGGVSLLTLHLRLSSSDPPTFLLPCGGHAVISRRLPSSDFKA